MSSLEMLSPQNCAIALIDFQPAMYQGVQSHDRLVIFNNVQVLAKASKLFKIPTVLSTVEAKPFAGFFMPEITEVFPQTEVIDRSAMNAWLDVNFRNAVRATGRKKLVIAGLWTEACVAFPTLDLLISNHLAIGSVFAEPQTSVANVTIQLSWGFVSKSSWQTTFTMVRFWRRRHDEIARLLKPMICGLPYQGQKTIALSYVTSGHTDSVQSTSRPTATKAYQAAERFLACDNRPTKGDRCGHCAYLTICPNAPTYSP